jgi:allantoicase
MKLTSYSVAPDGLKGFVKSPVIWGNYPPNISAPLAYLKKPKWMDEKDWRMVLASIRLFLPEEHNFKVKKRTKQ